MNSSNGESWFATCPKGVESLLADELRGLGAQEVRETIAGVHFSGTRALAYRACLWSRLANRILWPLGQLAAGDADILYNSLLQIEWGRYFEPSKSIAVDFSGESRSIRNTQFGAQRSKDAVVDWFKEKTGMRPSVDRRTAQVRLNIRLVRDRAHLAIDFAGSSLHQRGYRLKAGVAPLKENLAAAILLRADWPGVAARGGALIDPMCGSGTLLIEAAMMAADIAPGLARSGFGFEHLLIHDQPQWRAIVSDARGRAERGRAMQLPEIRGYDANPGVIRRAQENISRIGLQDHVRVSCRPLAELKKPTHKPMPFGLLVCNPPYGERLGDKKELVTLYRQLGEVMMAEFPDWQAAIFTSEKSLGKATGLRSHKRYALYNGAIETSLLLFDLANNRLRDVPVEAEPVTELSPGAQMFANRIIKNRKRLASWLKRELVECYRLYDADMPEYAVAVDIYGERVHVAEYKAPRKISPEAAQKHMEEVRAALPEALGIAPDNIVYKERSRQRGTQQYGKQGDRGEMRTVVEGQARLLVNLRDYLDTGLFLDHRPLRLRIAAEAKGKDFLNLFCYTGTASVHAALGGARSTTSVDLSNTYLDWLRKNLAANNLDEKGNIVIKADCATWLTKAEGRYDLILLDPPSFSNSKSLDTSFDVQRDHDRLVRDTMALLREGGHLYFSNNLRGFKLNEELRQAYDCEDITRATLGPDFQRNSRIHCCWSIRHKSAGK